VPVSFFDPEDEELFEALGSGEFAGAAGESLAGFCKDPMIQVLSGTNRSVR